MLRKYVSKIFKPKVYGETKKKTTAEEEFIKDKFGLSLREAKRIKEVIDGGHVTKAIELFEAESTLDVESMQIKKKIDTVKELSRLRI